LGRLGELTLESRKIEEREFLRLKVGWEWIKAPGWEDGRVERLFFVSWKGRRRMGRRG
jgi:hypothetical protein